jgi:hypothetical protein
MNREFSERIEDIILIIALLIGILLIAMYWK